MEDKLIIGSHVNDNAPDFVLGSVKEALSYDANALMFYTGAPQNSFRRPVSELKGLEAQALLKSAGISISNVVVHAPYFINLANSIKPELFEFSLKALIDEINRVDALGFYKLVLHPGSHVKAGFEVGINKLIEGLNKAIEATKGSKVKILIETMAGKGAEIGITLEQVRTILSGVNDQSRIGVCLDTCHLHDAGYDLTDTDAFVKKVDEIIGLHYVEVIHINDSKNVLGAHKDRHENIGYGFIGFETLCRFANHPAFKSIPKILETPYINEKAPYKEEIKALREHVFNDTLKSSI